MKSAFNPFSLLLALAIVLSVAACSGGGGSSGGGGNTGPSISLSTHSLTFSAGSPGAYVAPQTITATLNGVSSGTVYVGIVSTGTAVQSISDISTTSPTTGNATVYPAASGTLGSGTHKSTITVTACLNDPTCATGVLSGSPQTIDVTYQVGGLVATPTAASFSALDGATPPPLDIDVSGPPVSGPLTTSVQYSGTSSGWLTATPGTSATLPATIRLSAVSLPSGSYSATVNLNVGDYTLPLPVTYTVTGRLATGTTSASFSAVSGQTSLPAAASIAVTTTGGGTETLTAAVTYGAGATGWLNVTGNSAPGNLVLAPNTTNLASGHTYTASVALSSNAGGSPTIIDVSYTVAASVLTLSPASPSFSLDVNSTSADQYLKRTIVTGDTGASLSWTAASSAPWLTVTGSGVSGNAASLALVPGSLGALPNGVSTATVTFTYNGPGVVDGKVTANVTVNLNIPAVDFVSPYVAEAGTTGSVIVRGSGFNNLAGRSISFGNSSVASYTVIGDTEIRVDHPALAEGSYPVRISSGLDINRGSAQLVVTTPPAFVATTLAYPNTAAKSALRVTYDAERKALLVATAYPSAGSGGDILRYAYSGASWTASPISQYVPTLRDLGLSTDGQKIIALSNFAVSQFDPISLAAGPLTSAPFSSFYYLMKLAMTNDGTALVTTGLNGSGSTDIYRYDARNPALSIIGTYPNNLLYFGTPGVSLDGSLAVIVQGWLSPPPAVERFDASTGTLSASGMSLNQAWGSAPVLDRTGSRIVLNGYLVFNKNFVQLGSLACGGATNPTVLAPNGSRAYCYAGGTTLRTYDLTASPVAGTFPEIGTGVALAGSPGANPTMAISPDGGTVFIAGSDMIVVQPVP